MQACMHACTHARTCAHTHTYTHNQHPLRCVQPKKKEDNMSPEMKKRLREEYVGLGGTPNKVSQPRKPCMRCKEGRHRKAAVSKIVCAPV
eukprot:scaffold68362_cov20-Tisochrysis_lutea.AAC.1